MINLEHAKTFKNLFTGLQRGHGILRADGTYQYVKGQPTTRLYQQHLEGKISLGIVPITDKGNCRFGALDLDDHKKDKNNIQKFDYKTLLEKIKFLKLPLTVCKSKSGGAHCYLWLDQYYKAGYIRHILKKFAYALGYERDIEIFPKQEALKPTDNGNFINLPYYKGNSRVLIDFDGRSLNVTKALEYTALRVTNGDNLKKFKLLDHNKSTGRNDRTFAACSFIKKHSGHGWQEQLDKYNKIFNVPPLEEKELDSTVIKSNEKKDYNNGSKESPPDAAAWRQGTKAKNIRETVYEDIPAVVEGLIFPGITFINGKSFIIPTLQKSCM